MIKGPEGTHLPPQLHYLNVIPARKLMIEQLILPGLSTRLAFLVHLSLCYIYFSVKAVSRVQNVRPEGARLKASY